MIIKIIIINLSCLRSRNLLTFNNKLYFSYKVLFFIFIIEFQISQQMPQLLENVRFILFIIIFIKYIIVCTGTTKY